MIENANACKPCVFPLSTTKSLKRGILVASKEPANGFSSMKISRTGNVAALRVSFGYLQILDVENQFCLSHLLTKTSKTQKLAPPATFSSRTTTTYRKM